MDHPSLAAPIARLIDQFHRLPGIGPKMAQRLTYHLIRMPLEESKALASAISLMKEQITFCEICQNITEISPCPLCSNQERDTTRICVVQDPLDVLALERTGVYKGLYHVIHGVIDPMNSVGPDKLRLRELLTRLQGDTIQEVLLAMNPNVEGEATAMYINQLIAPFVGQVTRLARGLPVGGDLEYADDLTLARAVEGRQLL
jgi:recombination protein RecR